MKTEFNHAANDSPRSGSTKKVAPVVGVAIVIAIIVVRDWPADARASVWCAIAERSLAEAVSFSRASIMRRRFVGRARRVAFGLLQPLVQFGHLPRQRVDLAAIASVMVWFSVSMVSS